MGIGRALRLMRGVEDVNARAASVAIGGGDVAQVAHLPSSVATAFGINTDTDTVTRAQAMTVPAVRRGRQVIAGTLGTLPLVALRSTGQGSQRTTERVPEDHATARLLEQPDPNLTRAHVLTWTLDDLIFYPVSWWRVLDRDGSTGYPISAERIAPHRIRVDVTERRVYVDNVAQADADMIRFDAPDEGALTHGGGTLRTCLRLEAAVRRMSELDVPLGVFTEEEGSESLDDDEVDALLAGWADARRGNNWAFMRNLKATPFQFDARMLQLAELRAFQAGEVARLMGLRPRWVNAPTGESMTYSTTEGERRDLLDIDLAPYTAAIAQRLSMPDVTPRGQRVEFDATAFLLGTTRELLEAAEVGIRAKVITPDEVRVEWMRRAPLPAGAFPDPPAAPAAPDDDEDTA